MHVYIISFEKNNSLFTPINNHRADAPVRCLICVFNHVHLEGNYIEIIFICPFPAPCNKAFTFSLWLQAQIYLMEYSLQMVTSSETSSWIKQSHARGLLQKMVGCHVQETWSPAAPLVEVSPAGASRRRNRTGGTSLLPETFEPPCSHHIGCQLLPVCTFLQNISW